MSDHVFTADLGGTKCSAAVIDRKGRLIAHRVEPADLSSPSAPILQIRKLAREFAGASNPESAFSAAGVAIPGLARPDGTVWAPNLPGWKRMPLASRLRRSLNIPVVVESDRNAAVLGERWRGAARGKSDAIVLIIGTGIGAGILSGGRLIRGAHELAGCAGWLAVTGHNNRRASQVGELESLCAGPALSTAAQESLREGQESILSELDSAKITARDVAAAARRGDQLAIEIFTQAGTFLGYAVANLVSLFNPEIVIIAGGMAGAADLYLESLKRIMSSRAQPLAARQTKIVVSKLRDSANLIGCARLAWEAAAEASRLRAGGPATRKVSALKRKARKG